MKKGQKSRKTYLQNRRQEKRCYSFQSFKTSIKLWVKLEKIHRIIQFKQKAWLKIYIDMNT